eukprot:sb/3461310/
MIRTDTSKQPIRTRYLGHVTGYPPIRDQYFLIRYVPGDNPAYGMYSMYNKNAWYKCPHPSLHYYPNNYNYKMKIVLVCLLAVAFAEDPLRSVLRSSSATANLFRQMKVKNHLTFGRSEDSFRFRLFKSSAMKVADYNEDVEDTAQYGINQFSFMTPMERQSYLGLNVSGLEMGPEPTGLQSFNGPEKVLWTNTGDVTPVENQGSCGCCWTFGAVGALETHYKQKSGVLRNFAEQESGSAENGGRIAATSAMPYRGSDGTCRSSSTANGAKAYKITGDTPVSRSERAHLEALTKGSIAVAFEVTDKFFSYDGNIMKDTTCRRMANHAVTMVGYTKSFILVKNSWGANWGDQGFVKFTRNFHNCHLYDYSSYPALTSTGASDSGSDAATTYKPDESDDDPSPIQCEDKTSDCINMTKYCSGMLTIDYMKKNCAKTCDYLQTTNCVQSDRVGPRFNDILGGKVFVQLIGVATKSGSNIVNFLYRGNLSYAWYKCPHPSLHYYPNNYNYKMKIVLVCLLAVAFAEDPLRSVLRSSSATANLFRQMKVKNHLTFGRSEDSFRFRLFKSSAMKVADYNEDVEDTAQYGINQFSFMTPMERQSYLGLNVSELEMGPKPTGLQSFNGPEKVLWTNTGDVTPVENQGSCGCCWTFGAVGALETHYKQKSGVLRNFAEQESGVPGLVQSTWTVSMREIRTDVEVDGCTTVTNRVPRTVAELPLPLPCPTEDLTELAFEVTDKFFSYDGSIMKDTTCRRMANHAVTMVGYTKSFILVKNSWGANWGDQGFVKFARNYHNCSLYDSSSYPALTSTGASDSGSDAATTYKPDGIDDDPSPIQCEDKTSDCINMTKYCSGMLTIDYMKKNCAKTCDYWNHQSDPDLVTFPGERVLVTKSGRALNYGQIPLISYIGGNLFFGPRFNITGCSGERFYPVYRVVPVVLHWGGACRKNLMPHWRFSGVHYLGHVTGYQPIKDQYFLILTCALLSLNPEDTHWTASNRTFQLELPRPGREYTLVIQGQAAPIVNSVFSKHHFKNYRFSNLGQSDSNKPPPPLSRDYSVHSWDPFFALTGAPFSKDMFYFNYRRVIRYSSKVSLEIYETGTVKTTKEQSILERNNSGTTAEHNNVFSTTWKIFANSLVYFKSNFLIHTSFIH